MGQVEHSKYKGVIVCTTDTKKLREGLKVKADELTDFLVFRLEQIGVECIKIARKPGTYHDVTGNLRSSINFEVLVNGQPVRQGTTEQFDGTQGHGENGPTEAQKLLNSLHSQYPKGVVLVVVAGMSYAAYVENIRHKVVLTEAKYEAEKLIKQLLGNVLQ